MSIFHPIKRIKKVLNLYDELICTQFIKHKSRECLNKVCGKGEVVVDFLGMYDHKNITYFYVITGYPEQLPLDFKDKIRRECREGVRVSFFNNIVGHKISWDSAQMRSKLRILQMASDEQNEKEVTAYNMSNNIKSLNRQEYIERSLLYLSDADLVRERTLVQTSVMMTISGQRGEFFDDSVKAIEDYCEHIRLKATRVVYDVLDIINYYSPFKNVKMYKKGADNIPAQIVTDEIVARFNTYNQGILGRSSKRATYFGTDIYSGFPILKTVKINTEAPEIWLCTAETGAGKSYYIKVIILQLLALNMNGTIMDVEGTEYLSLAKFCSRHSKVLVLNMAEGVGKYFDPVEVPRKTGIEEIDKDARNMSINFTQSIFQVILGKAYEENVWLSAVVNDIVALTYERFGVTEEQKTWSRSRGMSLFDVYETLKIVADYCRVDKKDRKLMEDRYQITFPSYINNSDYYIDAVEQAITFASPYFEPNGLRASLFKDRVLVSDIADADLVVCSFGMAGKSEHAVDSVQMALMQLSAAQISHQRSIFSKAKGKFNFKVWEEFQRWGKFPNSDKTIGVAVTGGRKLGDINIVITNVVKSLLDDDRFGIFSNKTSYMIGAIDDTAVRYELAERLSIPNMEPELDCIAKADRADDNADTDGSSSSTSSAYRFSFLVGLDNSKFGIAKMTIPKDMRDSELFRTGIVEKGEQNGDT